MKKIIIAAIVAATGFSAIGSACMPEPTPDVAWVYKWSFKGKTTTGKSTKIAASACSPSDDCTIRIPSSLKIQGYTYACSPSPCEDGSLGFKTAFAEVTEVFWLIKPYKSSFAGGVVSEVVNLIGKKKKQVELGGVTKLTDVDTFTDWNLTFAGLGKYSSKKGGYITSVKGNFAGYASSSQYVNPKSCTVLPAGVWECDTLSLICDETPTVCYGKWSVKYKKNASKKYNKTGKGVKLPRWVKMANAE